MIKYLYISAFRQNIREKHAPFIPFQHYFVIAFIETKNRELSQPLTVISAEITSYTCSTFYKAG
jgi:hypothetical protein